MPSESAMREAAEILRKGFGYGNTQADANCGPIATLIDEKDAVIARCNSATAQKEIALDIQRCRAERVEKQIADLKAEKEEIRKLLVNDKALDRDNKDSETLRVLVTVALNGLFWQDKRIKALESEKEGYVTLTVEEFNTAQRAKAEIIKLKAELEKFRGMIYPASDMEDYQKSWEILDNERKERIKELEAELIQVREEGQKDYDGMREFQAKFIESDHRVRWLEAEVARLKGELNERTIN